MAAKEEEALKMALSVWLLMAEAWLLVLPFTTATTEDEAVLRALSVWALIAVVLTLPAAVKEEEAD